MRAESLISRIAGGLLCVAFGTGVGGCSSAELGTGEHTQRDARRITQADAALEPVVESNNRFALSVYQASASPGQNLFFSPFSLSLALGMTYAGARGTTADELHDALFVTDAEAYHAGLGALAQDLGGEHAGRGYELYVASRLFGAEGVAWSAETLDLLSGTYQAPLVELPFGSDPEGARTTVNDWVGEQTRDRVLKLVQQGDFDSRTLFALVNACYFAASWDEAFDPKQSHDGPFALEDGSSVSVPMLSRRARQLVAEDDLLTLVELDYADRELSMLLLIPHLEQGLAEVEANLSVERLDQLLSAAVLEEATLELPRLELRSELALDQVLQSLGVHDAFDDLRADFSGMLAEPVDPGYLFLTRTRHQAYVQLDEQGTRAAAATAVVAGTRAAFMSYSANHPFAFVIRDKLTGTYLFAGRVVDPR